MAGKSLTSFEQEKVKNINRIKNNLKTLIKKEIYRLNQKYHEFSLLNIYLVG